VAYRRGLYLLARLEDADRLRTLALERIHSAEWIRGSSFEFPDGFDPEDYFRDALFISPGEPRLVELVFTASTEPFIRIRRFHHSQRLSRMRDGRIRMTLRVPAGPGDFEIVNFVMAFGKNVEVVRPRSLRRRVRDELEAAVRLYD
jgi:predicted DNA-binding transcriptional regulator YafY